ncbi:DUF4142 domain-containing protein [Pelagerythrobacter rhizovicinus]|uniref:DUF4142 domain-containing protein n=1 Tax=Pelagerythrobacter rhizovicinus TaxID=2268576 RepID=A0A4Q2KLW0_9SPHN|nr:DUF4142 domain-containing protein [Pelagerythrobacter rhizovicinus]RXZ66308.1 DUF4142 domain-containing protein [Pelagerythrobacter rhizovicinus]
MTGNDEKHEGVRRTMDKAGDVVGGMVGRMTASTAGSTRADEFVKSAAIGDLYEIAAARLALRRSRTDEVRAAATKMIADHTTSTHHLRSALRMNSTRGLPAPPLEMDERRKTMIDHLKAAPDDKFDKTYVDQQVLAHKETVDLMTGFREHGDSPQLRSLAAGTAPVVQRHLAHMERLRARLA